MESMNIMKGYNKVNLNETPKPPSIPTNNHRSKLIAITLTVFLTLLITCLIAILIKHESSEENEPKNQFTLLHKLCSVTQHPKSCFSSISSLNHPPINDSPLHFFNLSLIASTIQVSRLRSTTDDESPAIKDCVELFQDSASQLEKSCDALIGVKVLSQMRISDLQTWISAAMTDQETCIDGLEEMGSTAVDEFKLKVQRSNEYMSNSLAILNNIHY